MSKLKNFLFIVVGNFILACSVQWFITPYDIPVGGVTGLAVILSHLSKMSIETIVLIINIICLPIAYYFSGKELMFGSIIASIVYPFCLAVVKWLPDLSVMSDSLLMSTLLSGILSGIGIGLVLKVGASTGGLDIVCIVLSNKLKISLSAIMWIIDTVIMIGEAFFVKFSIIVYGIIGAYLMIKLIDRVMNSGELKYSITVVSQYYDQIRDIILKEDEGVTLTSIESGLKRNQQKAIITVISARKLNLIEDLILEIDQNAFLTVQKVYDVKGRGFTSNRVYLEKD